MFFSPLYCWNLFNRFSECLQTNFKVLSHWCGYSMNVHSEFSPFWLDNISQEFKYSLNHSAVFVYCQYPAKPWPYPTLSCPCLDQQPSRALVGVWAGKGITLNSQLHHSFQPTTTPSTHHKFFVLLLLFRGFWLVFPFCWLTTTNCTDWKISVTYWRFLYCLFKSLV